MSRYFGRGQSSPYGSIPGGIPAVTDEDFSYITSQDLEGPAATLEDDVLIIKNKGVTYPVHFPAYAIGDGKLRVSDVRHRVGVMMDLSAPATRRMKLLYKGQKLKEPAAPVRDYGVKNKSELMAVISDARDESSPSDEELVIVKDKKKKRNRKKTKKGDVDGASSSRDSTSNLDGTSPSSTPGSVAMKKLDELSHEFSTRLHPLCKEYIASPPSDPKRRDEDHRRISETILQNILLKLDAVDTEGVAEVRARRKELVSRAQDILKALDVAKASQG
ncbi:BAG domain protein [Moelleriella libera RCEF 2490]|uniref:BAG domain protein n=1 Tax=Moelleriella libera RCEF 2490 TaxID=1081109 RepID=A0A162IWQ3_9HYPO|nr:BAG domain protein [Moelleriella libera RCEF 2490]